MNLSDRSKSVSTHVQLSTYVRIVAIVVSSKFLVIVDQVLLNAKILQKDIYFRYLNVRCLSIIFTKINI